MPARCAWLRAVATSVLAVSCALLAGALPAGADPDPTTDPGHSAVEVTDQAQDTGDQIDPARVLAPVLQTAAEDDPSALVQVSVSLSQEPIAEIVPENAIDDGTLPPVSEQRAVTAEVVQEQDAFVDAAADLGAVELGRASQAANVVALELPAGAVATLAHHRGVRSIKPINKYKTQPSAGASGSLAQAASYVQATSLRKSGITGRGVRVAVLDTGIDFTHADFAGQGTVAAYQNCYSGADGRAFAVAPVGVCADVLRRAGSRGQGRL